MWVNFQGSTSTKKTHVWVWLHIGGHFVSQKATVAFFLLFLCNFFRSRFCVFNLFSGSKIRWKNTSRNVPKKKKNYTPSQAWIWYDPSAGHQSLHLSKVHLNIGLRAIKESRRMAELVTGCVCSTGIAFPGCSGHDCSTGPWFLKKRWPFLSFHIQSVPQVICKNRHPSWLAKLVVAWQPCHMQIEGEHVAKEYLGQVVKQTHTSVGILVAPEINAKLQSAKSHPQVQMATAGCLPWWTWVRWCHHS